MWMNQLLNGLMIVEGKSGWGEMKEDCDYVLILAHAV
jgi:hypothetical protein